MAGLFSLPTPDAVRANATQQASQRAGLFSQAPRGRAGVAAASQAGGLFGEALGRAAGGTAPGEKEAIAQQQVQQLVAQQVQEQGLNLSDPNDYIKMTEIAANAFNKLGMTDLAAKAGEQGLAVHEMLAGMADKRSKAETRGMGGSEFERLSRKYEEGRASEVEKKRLRVLSGLEMRAGAEQRLDQTKQEFNIEQTNKLNKQYTQGSRHFKDINTSIESALAAMNTGDTELSDKLLAQVMSQVQDTDVRAFQMYSEFNKPFGNLVERMTGQLSRFFQGARTAQERETIAKTLQHYRQNYSEPGLADTRTLFRNNAVNRGLDPFEVVPPSSPEDIRDYPNVKKEEKIRLLKLYFPERFSK